MHLWYTIHTKPHQEKVAELNIRSLGIETLYPKIKKEKIIRRKKRDLVLPLFPGYLFAYFNLETHYRMVHYAGGVNKVVSFGDQPPMPVDNQVIEAINDRMKEGYISLEPIDLAPGDLVEIKDGPFEGLSAIFEREMPDKERVVLLLDILSRQTHILIDRQRVERLK